MLRLILQGILVFVVSLILGGVAVYLITSLRRPEVPVLKLNLVQQDDGIVNEVFDASGMVMDQLSYSFEKPAERQKVAALLQKAGINSALNGERIMVEGGKTGIAMDLLALKGLIPGVDNFSFTEVTAEEGTLRHKLQQRLATQNMLANMIATMTEGVDRAQVNLEAGETLDGDISKVKVVIDRQAGVNGLKVTDLAGIRENVSAMTGVEDISRIDIIDSKTGNKY